MSEDLVPAPEDPVWHREVCRRAWTCAAARDVRPAAYVIFRPTTSMASVRTSATSTATSSASS